MTPTLRGAHRFWPEKNCCQTTTQTLSKRGKTHVLHCTHWHPSFLVHMRGGLCVPVQLRTHGRVSNSDLGTIRQFRRQSPGAASSGADSLFWVNMSIKWHPKYLCKLSRVPSRSSCCCLPDFPPCLTFSPFFAWSKFLQVLPPGPAGLSHHTVLVKRPYREDTCS